MLGVNTAAEDAPPLIPAEVNVETVADGFKFTEGPALAPDGSIYFTDIPNNRIHRFDPETGETAIFREDSGGANGLAFMGDKLVACAGADRNVMVFELDREQASVLISETHPKQAPHNRILFNSPNDLVFDRKGNCYITDPRYGKRDDMSGPEAVYYLRPHDRRQLVYLVIDNLVRPNGIALSPDEKTLYVNDHGAKKVMAYPLTAPGKVGEGKVLYDTAEVGGPDGMCVDHAGRLYVAIFDGGGILVLSPEGQRLGFIATGPQTTNCTFGADGRTLYVTADKSLKRVVLNTGTPEEQPDIP